MLVEVFLRLPHRRSLIQCSSVCKRWHSLISNPKFTHRFIQFHHKKRCSSSSSSSLPYTILLISTFNDTTSLGEVLSKKSKIIHGKQPSSPPPSPPSSSYSSSSSSSSSLSLSLSSSGLYQNIWPPKAIIIASFDDLLLISDPKDRFGICNPLTRQLFWLPDVPGRRYLDSESRGFVCELKNNFKEEGLPTINDLYRFKVLVFRKFGFLNEDYPYKRKGIIFCSETGKWSNLIISFPPKVVDPDDIVDGFAEDGEYGDFGNFVACNGVLYALEQGQVNRFLAIDLPLDCTSEDEPKQCRFIDLPIDSRRRWAISRRNICYGEVQGQLRFAQMAKVNKKYELKVWGLDFDKWVLVHNIRLEQEYETSQFLVALHPHNGNAIFISHNDEIYKYDIGEINFKCVSELGGPYLPSGRRLTDAYSKFFEAVTLVYPSWPTPVPISPNA